MVILLVLTVAVDPQKGILADSYNYVTYSEPYLLQSYLAETISAASNTPGEFTSVVRTTGQPYDLEFSKVGDVGYVSIGMSKVNEYLPNVKFDEIDPMSVLTKCSFGTTTLQLQKQLSQIIFVQKKEEGNDCIIYFTASDTSGQEKADCQCADWNDDVCGGGFCTISTMHQTRTCPNSCDIVERCVTDNSCNK
jgi:hypothetical protein